MAVKFSVTEGGFVKDTSVSPNMIEFRVEGYIENPNLVSITAPAYTLGGLAINTATLLVDKGQVGSFILQVRSANADGTSETTHISGTVTISSTGPQGISLTISNATIAATKVVKLYLQYVSGDKSSDISVILE